jgi:hypothetical protein
MVTATLADIETSLLRPLKESESAFAPQALARAESIIRAYVPDFDDRALDADYRYRAATIEADMVARFFRSPDGIVSESYGLYTYRLDVAVASGVLALTPAERIALGGRGGFSVGTGELDSYARNRYPTNRARHAFLSGG